MHRFRENRQFMYATWIIIGKICIPAIILELISGTYRIGIGKIKYDSTRISAFSLKYSFWSNKCNFHFKGEYFPLTIPLIIIGMLCLGSGAFALILPETLNKILPDTTEDSELLIVRRRDKEKKNNENLNNENVAPDIEDASEREILRAKLFSEDWVDAGNGILVNFTENKNSEWNISNFI